MSHKKLREEKNCLNCGQTVEDRYCPHCGQENLQIQDSAFHLIIHYIQDLFHYDGKFWHTLKILLLKPGQVAVEYMEGKRRSNLEPLRFYVFASTVFFLLFFYFINVENWRSKTDPKFNYQKRLYNLEQEKEFIAGSPDTAYIDLLRNGVKERMESNNPADVDTSSGNAEFNLSIPSFADSTESGWLSNWLEKRADQRKEEWDKKHEGDQNSVFLDFMGVVLHKLPQLLFLSMPFFAFFLKLLYFRKRRNYVEHFIFSIYFFAYMFVVLAAFLLIQNIPAGNKLLMNIAFYINGALMLYLFIYLMLAMKRFYHDRWRYLIPRYILLLGLHSFMFLMLFIIILFVTYLW
ncbi:MAG TPA: DUF3667 domain-containing protein [Saprospiraceae bacterium]|nr:DUF3667 domain-containing protein [Saprospiraceae bacterium]